MQQEIALYRTTKGFQQNHKTSELKCNNCKQAFLANRKTAKFCSSSCRSQYWMSKNNKKVITIAVPADIDEAYLEKIKSMLENYKPGDNEIGSTAPVISNHNKTFETEKDLKKFMKEIGLNDYKIPKHEAGIYYDEGLTIKKTEIGFEVKIVA